MQSTLLMPAIVAAALLGSASALAETKIGTASVVVTVAGAVKPLLDELIKLVH